MFFLSIVIFRNLLISKGIIVNADLRYHNNLQDQFNWHYPTWNSHYSRRANFSQLPFYLLFFSIAFLLGFDTTKMLILAFIFIETLTGVSMYYATYYLIEKTYKKLRIQKVIASALSGIAYMWSPYIIAQVTHRYIRFAYALAPLILIFLIKGFDTKKRKYFVFSAFLWFLASGDPHWIVYGPVLLFSYIFYNFLFEFSNIKFNKTELTKLIVFYMNSLIVLVGCYLLFFAYFLIPILGLGGASSYYSKSLFGYDNAILINIFRFRVNWAIFERYHPIPAMVSIAIQTSVLLFSFVLCIFGILALVLRPNKYVLFLGVLLIESIVLTAGVNFIKPLFLWLAFDAPLHTLYGRAFRTPKIHQFVILSASCLSSFTVIEIMKIGRIAGIKLDNRNLDSIISLLVTLFLMASILLSSWPLATGDVNGELRTANIPEEYKIINSWLDEDEEENYRVLWIPKYWGREAYWNEGHRTGDFDDIYSSKATATPLSGIIYHFAMGIYFPLYPPQSDTLSVIYHNKTNNIGKILAPLSVKYIVLHDDIPSLQERTKILLKNLKIQKDLELVKQEGFIYVFKNKYYDSHISIASKNFLITGGLETLTTLSSIFQYNPKTTSVTFTNLKIYSEETLNFCNTIILTEDSRFENPDLIISKIKHIAPSDFVHHFEPDKFWSVSSSQQTTFHVMLEQKKIQNWDFDLGKGLVFTSAEVTSEEMTFDSDTNNYELFVRYFQNREGGEIGIYLDDNLVKKIETKDSSNDFVWTKIGSFNLTKGKHTLVLKNINGFNAVNLFGLVPSDELKILLQQKAELLNKKKILYLLEAESDFYRENISVSNKYNGTASSGRVIECNSKSKIWNYIDIMKLGEYKLAIKGKGKFTVKFNDSIYSDVNSQSLKWNYLDPIKLDKGLYRIEIQPTSQADLDVIALYSMENPGETLEDIFNNNETSATIMNIIKIDDTKYKLRINATHPFMLKFVESYDPMWQIQIGGNREIKSIPLYSVINGFYIEKTGNYSITIEFKLQKWFYIGSGITIISMFVSASYFLWNKIKRILFVVRDVIGKNHFRKR